MLVIEGSQGSKVGSAGGAAGAGAALPFMFGSPLGGGLARPTD